MDAHALAFARVGNSAPSCASRVRAVRLLIRGGDLRKSLSRYLINRIETTENIELLALTEVGERLGEDRLEGIGVARITGRAPAEPSGHGRFLSLSGPKRTPAGSKA